MLPPKTVVALPFIKRVALRKRSRKQQLGLLLSAALLGATSLGGSFTSQAHADRIDDLSSSLGKSSDDKARIAAAVSLGRLKDTRALRPLVRALRDKSPLVRAVSAASLGQLKDARALPALKKAASDPSKSVRKRATESMGIIRQGTTKDGQDKSYRLASRDIRAARYRLDGREAPLLGAIKPVLFVGITSTADKSAGRAPKAKRKQRAQSLRGLMAGELEQSRRLTMNAEVAQELTLPRYSIDLGITKLKRVVRGPFIELQVELKAAISNDKGKMLSFLSAKAMVQTNAETSTPEQEREMVKEALQDAVSKVRNDLVTYLIKAAGV